MLATVFVRTHLNLAFLSLLVPIGCSPSSPPPAERPATPADGGSKSTPVAGPAAPPETPTAAAATQPSAALPTAPLPDRDPELAHRLVTDHGAILLDVRTQGEFDDGHIDAAKLIPHDQLASRMDEVRKLAGDDLGKPIVLYCRSGKRAGLAKQVLLDQGFTHVTNLGGYKDW